MKENIDYSLIWKYFNSSLTHLEEEKLNIWLNSDIKHQQYFNRLKEQKSGNPNSGNIEIDSFEAWKNIKFPPKRLKYHFWKIGVAAGIFIIMVIFIANYIFKFDKEELVGIENIQFEPGGEKTTLVLDNGEKLELESKKDTLINQTEAIIKNKHCKLNYKAREESKEKTETEIKYNTLIVPRGGEYTLVLCDGTEVKVNSESMLKFPVVFDKNYRSVQLIGEAFFDVKTDSLRPFIVTSNNHVVKVYGTSFNIKSYENENYVATTLVEGQVSVYAGFDKTTEQTLTPGFQSIYKKDSNQFEQKEVDVRQFTSWKEGRFFFRNMSLEEMTNVLGRWYNLDFEFKNKEAKELRFNGNLKRYDNIQTLLNQIIKTNEVKFSAYGKTIYVE